MKDYLERTKPLRGDITSLFVTYVKPHKAKSKDAISRWIKTTLGLVGIDITRFKPHSIRSSSTSAGAIAKVPVDMILRTAGWSGQCIFAKYYKKPIQNHGELAKALLDSTQLGWIKLFTLWILLWAGEVPFGINVVFQGILVFVALVVLTNTGSQLLMGSLHWMMTK